MIDKFINHFIITIRENKEVGKESQKLLPTILEPVYIEQLPTPCLSSCKSRTL